VWLGVFEPDAAIKRERCSDCALGATARAGTIRALDPGDDRPAAAGDVVAVSPLLGAFARGHLDNKRFAVAWFVDDRRDNDDGVVVLPADTRPVLAVPSKADVAAIGQALLQLEQFGPHVAKALAGMQYAGLDLDGDGRADVVATYGCAQWGDGTCQLVGQVFLVRRGDRWFKIE
jgi:hypothetical protein